MSDTREDAGKDRSEELSWTLLESSPAGVVAVDSGGRIALFNEEAEKIFGYEKEEALGQPIELLLPDRLKGLHAKLRAEYLKAPEMRRLGMGRELWARRKDGSEFLAEIGLSPFTMPGGTVIAAFVADVTERKQLERMKDEFLSIVTHELKNPIGSIKLHLDALRDTAPPLSEEQARMISTIESDVARMMRMCANLLGMARLESGMVTPTLREIELRGIVERVAAGIAPEIAERGLRLEMDIPADIPRIAADADMMHDLFRNLVGNAIRFARSKIAISALKAHGAVEFAVSDDGPGVEPGEMHRLFTKFSQVTRQADGGYKGTGLGLAICKRIVELHGGRIWADNHPGRGISFRFTIPSAAA